MGSKSPIHTSHYEYTASSIRPGACIKPNFPAQLIKINVFEFIRQKEGVYLDTYLPIYEKIQN